MSTSTTLRDSVHKIHIAVSSGSLDRAAVDAALKDISKLADDLDGADKAKDAKAPATSPKAAAAGIGSSSGASGGSGTTPANPANT